MATKQYYCPTCKDFVDPILTARGQTWIAFHKGDKRKDYTVSLTCGHDVKFEKTKIKENGKIYPFDLEAEQFIKAENGD